MIKKILTVCSSILGLLTFSAIPAFAHVIVHPSTAGIASFQEFTMSVPTEKDSPTVAIKLLIPNGLQMVTPNVKPGWTINVVKNGSGDNATVTEIDWTGGSIPSGQRDDFYFQAQVPATETTLNWKAYQTYSDGSVVAWDHDPKLSKGPDDDSAPPPYSTTTVINDLTDASTKPTSMKTEGLNTDATSRLNVLALMSGAALILSIAAIYMQMKKK